MNSNNLCAVEVPLTQGFISLIDADAAELVLARKWHAIRCANLVYAATNIKDEQGKQRRVYLHRFVMGKFHGRDPVVDHINHNGLDNTKANLRFVTQAQNAANRRTWMKPAKGVYPNGSGWQAKIKKDGISHNLGTYKSEREALIAYNAAALVLYGREAHLNGGAA